MSRGLRAGECVARVLGPTLSESVRKLKKKLIFLVQTISCSDEVVSLFAPPVILLLNLPFFVLDISLHVSVEMFTSKEGRY